MHSQKIHHRVEKTFEPRFDYNTCALCIEERKLEGSHVIPRFVRHLFIEPKYFDWVNPGKVEQDFAKIPLLCRNCEELLSGNENIIARKVHAALGKSVQGLPTLHDEKYFAISILWRAYQAVARFQLADSLMAALADQFRENQFSSHITNSMPKQTDEALQTVELWRKFLLAPAGKTAYIEHRSWTLDNALAQRVGGGVGRYATGWNLLTGPNYQSVVVLMHSSVFIGPLLSTTDIESEEEGIRNWLNFLAEQNSVFRHR